MNIPVNEVTGRINELRDRHVLIRESGHVKGLKGYETTWDTFNTPDDRREAIYRRFRQLTNQIETLESDYHNGNSDLTTLDIKKKIDHLKADLKIIKQL